MFCDPGLSKIEENSLADINEKSNFFLPVQISTEFFFSIFLITFKVTI